MNMLQAFNLKCKMNQVGSSDPKVFLLKGVLQICNKFTGKHQPGYLF